MLLAMHVLSSYSHFCSWAHQQETCTYNLIYFSMRSFFPRDVIPKLHSAPAMNVDMFFLCQIPCRGRLVEITVISDHWICVSSWVPYWDLVSYSLLPGNIKESNTDKWTCRWNRYIDFQSRIVFKVWVGVIFCGGGGGGKNQFVKAH